MCPSACLPSLKSKRAAAARVVRQLLLLFRKNSIELAHKPARTHTEQRTENEKPCLALAPPLSKRNDGTNETCIAYGVPLSAHSFDTQLNAFGVGRLDSVGVCNVHAGAAADAICFGLIGAAAPHCIRTHSQLTQGQRKGGRWREREREAGGYDTGNVNKNFWTLVHDASYVRNAL